MQTKFSEILKLISEITKNSSCYILMAGNAPHVVDSVGEINLSDDLIIQFNKDVINYGLNSLKEFSSWSSLQENIGVNDVDLIPLYDAKETHVYLVILAHENIEKKENPKFDVYVKTLSRLVELETKIVNNNSQERLRTLINTAVDFIFSLNGFGYIVEVNENGANALGYSVEEMLGKHFLDFIGENDRAEISSSFQKMLTSKSTTHFEIDFLHKLKKSLKYEFLATPLLENNTIVGMMGIGRDISQRKKNEEAIKNLNKKLEKANKLVALERDRAQKQITVLEQINLLKNEFISNVSHELRTPLASIVGFAETLSSEDDLSPELIKEFSNIILTEGKRLARFIEDILDFSKLEEDSSNLKLEEEEIVSLIRDVISETKPKMEKKNINLITEIPEAEISIFADRKKLFKAILIIIENAISLTESDGQIIIFVQDFPNEVEIFVSDSGAGIPEENLKMFFEKFHSTGKTNVETPVAGAALSLAKQIVEYHKGVLHVKSIVGKGTTMILHLPKITN